MAAAGTDPASNELSITELDRDGVHVLRGSGELDLAAAGSFCARVDAARGAGHRRLLIDLTQLSFCDASGLRALIGAAEECVASGGHAALVPPTEKEVARLFALTGANERLPVHSSVAEGLLSLAGRHQRDRRARSTSPTVSP